jgi:hypothetical protein
MKYSPGTSYVAGIFIPSRCKLTFKSADNVSVSYISLTGTFFYAQDEFMKLKQLAVVSLIASTRSVWLWCHVHSGEET